MSDDNYDALDAADNAYEAAREEREEFKRMILGRIQNIQTQHIALLQTCNALLSKIHQLDDALVGLRVELEDS